MLEEAQRRTRARRTETKRSQSSLGTALENPRRLRVSSFLELERCRRRGLRRSRFAWSWEFGRSNCHDAMSDEKDGICLLLHTLGMLEVMLQQFVHATRCGSTAHV